MGEGVKWVQSVVGERKDGVGSWKLDRSRVNLRACRDRKVMIMKMRQRGYGSRGDF